jgi:LPXTG-motif cell wall-anchored protein
MKSGSRWGSIGLKLVGVAITLAFAASVGAQVDTTTTTSHGTPTKTSTVERGEVVTVQGNDLIVKMEDGTIRHFPNVPESARITVDGKSLGIHDLKPGMKLQRTITTTTTPRTITTVSTVSGTVWNVMPPNSVTLTMDNGKNQTFKIPRGQKFDINGQMVDAFGLRKGMNISATKVVETPETVVTQQRTVTGTMPTPPPQTKAAAAAPPPAPPADAAILIVMEEETPAPSVTPAKLPKTGSELPLLGLLGLLCVAGSFAVKLIRIRLAN